MLRPLSIHKMVAFVLWGVALLAFVVAGIGLLLYQSLTMERRARQILEPYAYMVSVGTDTAVAFEDPKRAQEILDTLQANPQILEADIFLDDGSVLASYRREVNSRSHPLLARPDGIYFSREAAELLQTLPSGARLRISIGLNPLVKQTRQAIWVFGVSVLILLAVTLAQLAVLRHTIVQPIGALTRATEQVQVKKDYKHRVPTAGADEVARLGQNFNAMMEAIQKQEDDLLRLAFHDPLTQLPNRRLLLNRLDQILAASARSRHWGALLFIDLDNFKILNDTRGHDAGDELLIEVARRLTLCVRKEDTVARFGGDEFMIMVSDLGGNAQQAAEQSKRVGEQVLSELNQPYIITGEVHHITPSVGITLFIGANKSLEELMKQADIAMYQAKSGGRNTLRFFDPGMQAALSKRAALEMALRRGIERHQFVLYFQPQVNSVRGIVGAEALLRWDHPERGIVPPNEFIPLAEETGLILPIGQWALESACKQLKRWANQPQTRSLQLAVNVSPRQFRQANFVSQVRSALEASGAPAMRLKIELTETLLIDDIEDSIEKMRALKKLGVGFSLDDFGTGYSSLSYLTQLPLEQLKIDQSFIHNLPDNHNDAVIAQTIITMASSLALAVIAEGVETEAQHAFLEQHGCSTYQGYLFSKPVTSRCFGELLSHRKRENRSAIF